MRRDDDGYPAPVDLDDARPVLAAQGAYYAATGLLPFASRRAFEAVTGPKREWWLVQTVGLLVTVVGGALVSGAVRRRTSPELLAVAAGSAASLGAGEVGFRAAGARAGGARLGLRRAGADRAELPCRRRRPARPPRRAGAPGLARLVSARPSRGGALPLAATAT